MIHTHICSKCLVTRKFISDTEINTKKMRNELFCTYTKSRGQALHLSSDHILPFQNCLKSNVSLLKMVKDKSISWHPKGVSKSCYIQMNSHTINFRHDVVITSFSIYIKFPNQVRICRYIQGAKQLPT